MRSKGDGLGQPPCLKVPCASLRLALSREGHWVSEDSKDNTKREVVEMEAQAFSDKRDQVSAVVLIGHCQSDGLFKRIGIFISPSKRTRVYLDDGDDLSLALPLSTADLRPRLQA